MPDDAVYVGRGTIFGNPFKITGPWTTTSTGPDYGKKQWMVETVTGSWIRDTKAEARALAVDLFRKWIRLPQQERLRAMGKLGLKGKDLVCWCPLTDANGNHMPCHADVWIEIAGEP